MTRKGDIPSGNRKGGVADRVLDQFRAKTRARRKAEADDAARHAARPKRQWIPIVFISIWLVLWSTGMALVGLIILSGEGEPGLWLWWCFALVGWVIAVWFLFMLIFRP